MINKAVFTLILLFIWVVEVNAATATNCKLSNGKTYKILKQQNCGVNGSSYILDIGTDEVDGCAAKYKEIQMFPYNANREYGGAGPGYSGVACGSINFYDPCKPNPNGQLQNGSCS